LPTSREVSIRNSVLGDENTLSVVGTFEGGVFDFSGEGGTVATVASPLAATLAKEAEVGLLVVDGAELVWGDGAGAAAGESPPTELVLMMVVPDEEEIISDQLVSVPLCPP
jgi:hypothetical protein